MDEARKKFIDGLRALADWFEAHPDIPTPRGEVAINLYSMDTKEEAATFARALGRCDKRYQDSILYISRRFGAIRLEALFMRDSVCTKRVVGTREIPEQVIPARSEEIIPARTEEIVEWDCEPILKPSDPEPVEQTAEATT